MGVIEFDLKGNILKVNENFADVTGYSVAAIVGQHRRMFVDSVQRKSEEYRAFWHKLAAGAYDARQYQRLGKNGRHIWLQASYNPIFDMSGKPFKVVKYASDISRQKDAEALIQGQLTS